MKCSSLRRYVTAPVLAGALITGNLISDATPACARDPWLQPFHQDSIWNMPIGTTADYVYAGVGAANYIDFDTEYFVRPTAADPVRDLYQAASWGDRDSGTIWKGKWRVLDSFVVADANYQSQPNNASAFLDLDGRTIRQLNATTRPTAGGNIWGYLNDSQNIYKKGYYGSHSGTGLSALGGSIRKGELTGSAEIRHVLKLTMHEKYFSYMGSTPGYRWPAFQTDGAANASWYTGTFPAMTMGSLVAINPNQTEASLGLETAAAKKVFRALRDFGAYVVDSAGWDAFYLNAETGVHAELQSQLGYNPVGSANTAWKRDMNRLVTNLHVVDDNGPNSIGGDGSRRVAKLAPLPAMPAPAGALSRAGWLAWGSLSNANNMLDGSLSTSANMSANQAGGEWITIDMGAPRTFNRILLETNVGDENKYPHQWTLYLSNSGGWGDWITNQSNSDGWRMEGETEILLSSPRTARYITIQQNSSGNAPWSVAELNVMSTLGVAPVGSTISMWSGAAGKFVSTDLSVTDSPLKAALATSVGTWERYRLDKTSDGFVGIYSLNNNRYVTVNNNITSKPLIAGWATGIQEWEKFTYVLMGNNQFALRSKVTGKYVSCITGSGGVLTAQTASSPGNAELFTWTAL